MRIFGKKKPVAYEDMSNMELIREIERGILLRDVRALMFRAVLGIRKFFGLGNRTQKDTK